MLGLDLLWCLADALIILWLNFSIAFSMLALAFGGVQVGLGM